MDKPANVTPLGDEDLPIFKATLMLDMFAEFPPWVRKFLEPPDFSDLIPAHTVGEMMALLSPTQVMEVLT